jgi:hypothetical protein
MRRRTFVVGGQRRRRFCEVAAECVAEGGRDPFGVGVAKGQRASSDARAEPVRPTRPIELGYPAQYGVDETGDLRSAVRAGQAHRSGHRCIRWDAGAQDLVRAEPEDVANLRSMERAAQAARISSRTPAVRAVAVGELGGQRRVAARNPAFRPAAPAGRGWRRHPAPGPRAARRAPRRGPGPAQPSRSPDAMRAPRASPRRVWAACPGPGPSPGVRRSWRYPPELLRVPPRSRRV